MLADLIKITLFSVSPQLPSMGCVHDSYKMARIHDSHKMARIHDSCQWSASMEYIHDSHQWVNGMHPLTQKNGVRLYSTQ